MTDSPKPVLVDVPEEKLELMQKAGEDLIESMLVMLPPQGDMPQEHYDSYVQHIIVGNAMLRVLIAMSEKMGELDPVAIRIGIDSALNYSIAVSEAAKDSGGHSIH